MSGYEQLAGFLSIVLGPSRPQKRNEYLYFCPLCHHHNPKLAVNLASGKWHCWVCGAAGRTLFSLLKKTGAPKSQFHELSSLLGTLPLIPTGVEVDSTPVILLPENTLPLWKPQKDYEHKHALAYLFERGLTTADIFKYQLGYCTKGPYQGRIIIPSFDESGRLNFFTARSYWPSQMPYLNPEGDKNIVGFENLISWYLPVVLCEGPFDAMAIKSNAIPLFGKSIPSRVQNQILTTKVEVYLALDRDALRDALMIAERLLQHDIVVRLVPLEDKDPSIVGFTEMHHRLRHATPLTFSDLIRTKLQLA